MSETEEYAEDVTDLREAQRLIAALRREVAELTAEVKELLEDAEPVKGEVTAFLDDEHADMLYKLYEDCVLYAGQDPDEEFLDAFTQFVSNWTEVQDDMARIDEDFQKQRRRVKRLRQQRGELPPTPRPGSQN